MRTVLVIVALAVLAAGCATEDTGRSDGLTNPCAATTCLAGTGCIVEDGQGVCVPIGETTGPDEEGFTACAGERPEVCTQEYNPVCGDNGETYSNACMACANANVQGYTLGEC